MNRRTFLKGALAAGAASIVQRPRPVIAAPEKTAVVIVFLRGGMNAIFSGADAFTGSGAFATTSSNVITIGNGLIVDKTAEVLPAIVKEHVVSVGIKHDIANHPGAREAIFTHEGKSPILGLAADMGGDAAIKAATCGTLSTEGASAAVNGVSLQRVADMGVMAEALGILSPEGAPDRAMGSAVLDRARKLGASHFEKNPRALGSLQSGFEAGAETLRRPALTLDFAEMAQAYGKDPAASRVDDMKARLLAAELMVRSGTNVVSVIEGNWDSHGDVQGTAVRTRMKDEVWPAMSIFLERMLTIQTHHVVTVLFGDFARSLPGSDHAPGGSALVFAKNLKPATTGKTNAQAILPDGTPSIPGFWGFVADAARAPTAVQRFGGNPHTKITLG